MPIWDFRCKDCGNTEEWLTSREEADKVQCTVCGGETERLVGNTSFRLKGDGWYKDGYSSKKESK